jgi:hypothetical protein
MESTNPFSGALNRTRRERKVVPAGIYQGVLIDVKTVQVKDKENPEAKKTKLLFAFHIDSHDVEVAQLFNISMADTSMLVKFLKSTFGDAFTPDIQASEERMWKFVQGLKGTDYNLVITFANGWNNIQTALPITKQVTKDEEPPAFPDDQIPF